MLATGGGLDAVVLTDGTYLANMLGLKNSHHKIYGLLFHAFGQLCAAD